MILDQNALKRMAAARAVEFIEDGMKLGLGTGSTAEMFLELLAVRVRAGLKVVGTATSERTAQKAQSLGIDLATLDDLAPLDLTVDGADEADRKLNLIKGGGGALLREKIVAASSRRMIVIVDKTKFVPRLGRYALPVEVVAFGHHTTAQRISEKLTQLGYSKSSVTLRSQGGASFVTDSGNLVYDCELSAITSPAKLSAALSSITGVVEHGLFIGLATTLIVALSRRVQVIEKAR